MAARDFTGIPYCEFDLESQNTRNLKMPSMKMARDIWIDGWMDVCPITAFLGRGVANRFLVCDKFTPNSLATETVAGKTAVPWRFATRLAP